MNLLIDNWLPVRRLNGAEPIRISLGDLLTSKENYEICLPRDDLELAALQLVTSIVQVLFLPKDLPAVVEKCRTPLTNQEYEERIQPYKEWFELEHPKYPFMQVRGVKAKDVTPMEKLMTGLTGATNSCFVNESGQADQLCGGCAAICLFNQASNAPGFGGGFKAGLRGSTPITTMVQGRHLRETIWLNILSSDEVGLILPDDGNPCHPPPTWIEPIKQGSTISGGEIGFLRGLLWQPAHIELSSSRLAGKCACCGAGEVLLYTSFKKAKFTYTVEGIWPHPHSPRILSFKNGNTEEKFASFTTPAPTWTRLASFVVDKEVNRTQKEGHHPAAVLLQARKIFYKKPERIRLAVGGYRNKQASILERRHEVFELNKGWHRNPEFVQEFVDLGIGFKNALCKPLYIFFKGMKEIKGAGVAVHQSGETQFYRRTDHLMQKALAEAHFENSDQLAADKDSLRTALRGYCTQIFEEQTRAYLNDPELIRTMAVSRKIFWKHLKALEPES